MEGKSHIHNRQIEKSIKCEHENYTKLHIFEKSEKCERRNRIATIEKIYRSIPCVCTQKHIPLVYYATATTKIRKNRGKWQTKQKKTTEPHVCMPSGAVLATSQNAGFRKQNARKCKMLTNTTKRFFFDELKYFEK